MVTNRTARRPVRPAKADVLEARHAAELELQAARHSATLDALAALLKVTPMTAFAYPAAQAAISGAETDLAVNGRGQTDERATATLKWLAERGQR